MSYYLHSAYHQSLLMSHRKSIDRVLRSSSTSDEIKRKLRLVREVKAYGESHLGLKPSQNYNTYVELEEPYVSYIVQAAYPFELKAFEWQFPLIGKVPYKGYFRRGYADAEAERLRQKEFDTYVRGVSAYSTLGWFKDSVLSSMMRYPDHDLVELILHETIHTTIFIPNAAEFNERLATFMGIEGMKQFYLNKEGANSTHLQQALLESEDQRLFSAFITRETEVLESWYTTMKGKVTPALKEQRLKEIQERFTAEVKPKLKTDAYEDFASTIINNATLIAYRTYQYSLDDFAKVYRHFDSDFKKTMNYLKSLENQPDPDQVLRRFSGS